VHVQNNGQIDKGREDSNIGDIGKPAVFEPYFVFATASVSNLSTGQKATLRFYGKHSKIRGFPPHPHRWFGFIDVSDFSRMGRYVNGKTRSSDLTVLDSFPRACLYRLAFQIDDDQYRRRIP